MASKKNNLFNKKTLESLKELGSVDGKSFFHEILNLFLNESEKIMRKIESQLYEKNFAELRISAHTLKGASANIGAAELSRLSSLIEEKAKENDDTNLGELHFELKECYDSTKTELINLIS